MKSIEHAALARKTQGVASDAVGRAANEVHAEGGSPRAQIDAARKVSLRPLVYLPHQGMKERLKRLKRMEQAK